MNHTLAGVWQNFPAGIVVLGVAKSLTYAGISARFFAAMKIGKSLAYASGYYFHRLWVARSAMSDCTQNDESEAVAISYCRTPWRGALDRGGADW